MFAVIGKTQVEVYLRIIGMSGQNLLEVLDRVVQLHVRLFQNAQALQGLGIVGVGGKNFQVEALCRGVVLHSSKPSPA